MLQWAMLDFKWSVVEIINCNFIISFIFVTFQETEMSANINLHENLYLQIQLIFP